MKRFALTVAAFACRSAAQADPLGMIDHFDITPELIQHITAMAATVENFSNRESCRIGAQKFSPGQKLTLAFAPVSQSSKHYVATCLPGQDTSSGLIYSSWHIEEEAAEKAAPLSGSPG